MKKSLGRNGQASQEEIDQLDRVGRHLALAQS